MGISPLLKAASSGESYPLYEQRITLQKKASRRDQQLSTNILEEREIYERFLASYCGGKKEVVLARGAYGRVLSLPDHPSLVMKLQSPRKEKDKINRAYCYKAACQERRILRLLTIAGVKHIPRLEKSCRVKRERVALVMERASKDIASRFIEPGIDIPLAQLEKLAKMYLEALEAMHRMGIAHFDIKPSNVSEMLFDFGLAREGLAERSTTRDLDVVATRYYRPLEVVLMKEAGTPVDMWSLGCMLFEMYTANPLIPVPDWCGKEVADVNQIWAVWRRLGRLSRFMKPSHLTHDFDRQTNRWILKPHTMGQCIDKMETMRESIESARERRGDPTERVNQFYDLILRMLQVDPEDRVTASDALKDPFFTSELATDVSFSVEVLGEKQGTLRIYHQGSKNLLETVDLASVGMHSCFHVQKADRYLFERETPKGEKIVEKRTLRDHEIVVLDTGSTFSMEECMRLLDRRPVSYGNAGAFMKPIVIKSYGRSSTSRLPFILFVPKPIIVQGNDHQAIEDGNAKPSTYLSVAEARRIGEDSHRNLSSEGFESPLKGSRTQSSLRAGANPESYGYRTIQNSSNPRTSSTKETQTASRGIVSESRTRDLILSICSLEREIRECSKKMKELRQEK